MFRRLKKLGRDVQWVLSDGGWHKRSSYLYIVLCVTEVFCPPLCRYLLVKIEGED